jgi:predicted O-methyltransferase YrrM
VLREIIPQAIRRNLRDTWFLVELSRVRRSLTDRPDGLPTRHDLQTLSRAWGNLEWAANINTLLEVCRRARQTRGPILECGSGLTTVLMGVLAPDDTTPRVTSLEHDPEWRQRVQVVLQRAGIRCVRLLQAPLCSYGDFDWYEKPASPPAPYTLVVCDGPPGATRGGRSGLLPVVADDLADGCVVVLDDAERPGEQETLRRWQEGWPVTVDIVGLETPPARAVVTYRP